MYERYAVVRVSFRASRDVCGLFLPGAVAKPLVRVFVRWPGWCRHVVVLAGVQICDRLWRARVAASLQCPVSHVDATDKRCRCTSESLYRRSRTSRLRAWRNGLQTTAAPRAGPAPRVPQTRPLAHAHQAPSRRAALTRPGRQTAAQAASMPSDTLTRWSLRVDRRFAAMPSDRHASRLPEQAKSIRRRRAAADDPLHPDAAGRCCLRPRRKG